MALDGQINNGGNHCVEQVATECMCGIEKLFVCTIYNEHFDDEVFIEMTNCPENFRQRLRNFLHGSYSHGIILSTREFFDFVDKLNILANKIKGDNS